MYLIDEQTEVTDDEFLKSLENLDEEAKKKAEEEQREKNKNAEEARKRREAEAKELKAKEEAEAQEKLKLEEEAKAKAEEEKKSSEAREETQKQLKELEEKYPDVDVKQVAQDADFNEYIQGKWGKNSKTLATLYGDYIKFRSKLSEKNEEEVQVKYRKSTPSITAKGGTAPSGIYSKEELEKITRSMPSMKPKEYASIQEKLNASLSYYKEQDKKGK